MDTTYAVAEGDYASTKASANNPNNGNAIVNTPVNQGGGTGTGAGGSYWIDPAQATSRIIGSYNYRGTSWAVAHGGTSPITSFDASASFVILTDFPDVRYGRKFCHQDGYNVAYGDGHAAFFSDPPDKNGYGLVEKKITGVNGHTNWDGNNPTPIDGITGWNAGQRRHIDEEIYKFMGTQGR